MTPLPVVVKIRIKLPRTWIEMLSVTVKLSAVLGFAGETLNTITITAMATAAKPRIH